MKVLLVDNYDSFTYNLAQMLDQSGLCNYEVVFNDKIDVRAVAEFDKILISPGPGLPFEAGILSEVIRQYIDSKPMLGICLGHQAISEVLGARLIRMTRVQHGQVIEATISQPGDPLFNGIPLHIQTTLYHSWTIDPESVTNELRVLATNDNGQIQAIRRKGYPVWGVQFHPESVGTEYGARMIENWLRV